MGIQSPFIGIVTRQLQIVAPEVAATLPKAVEAFEARGIESTAPDGFLAAARTVTESIRLVHDVAPHTLPIPLQDGKLLDALKQNVQGVQARKLPLGTTQPLRGIDDVVRAAESTLNTATPADQRAVAAVQRMRDLLD